MRDARVKIVATLGPASGTAASIAALARAGAKSRGNAIRVPGVVARALRPGAEVLFGDGGVGAVVVSARRGVATARVTAGGRVASRAGVHVRGADGLGRVPTAYDLRVAR